MIYLTEFEEVEQPMENEFEMIEEVEDIPSLLRTLLSKENEYRQSKLDFDKEFNRKLVTLNWDLINEERKQEGLPKLGSREMREAFIKELLQDEEQRYINAKVDYHHCYRLYEMALKYSFEILR